MRKIDIPGKRPIAIYPTGGKSVYVPGGGGAVEVFVSGISWYLNDNFTTALPAGSVNGTAAEPGPGGNRILADIESIISVTGENLIFPLTTADHNYSNNQILWPLVISRTPGRILTSGFFSPNEATYPFIASFVSPLGLHWDSYDSHVIGAAYFSNNLHIINNGTGINVATLANNNQYSHKIVLRDNGLFAFVRGGGLSNTSLLYTSNLGNSTPLQVGSANIGYTENRISKVRIPTALWLPTPLLSTSGAMTWPLTNGLGHAEGVAGGLGSGGSGLTMLDAVGTWGIAGGKIVATALDTGVAITVCDVGKADVLCECIPNYSADTCGFVARYIDTLNYVYVTHDGTNVKLYEVIAGTATERGTAVKAPAASARLIVDVSGTVARVYYNEEFLFSYATLNAAFTTATKIGLRTTNVLNSFNSAVVYAKGTGGEYNILDKYSQ